MMQHTARDKLSMSCVPHACAASSSIKHYHTQDMVTLSTIVCCCRPAVSVCEEEAVCDGVNPSCPPNPPVREEKYCGHGEQMMLLMMLLSHPVHIDGLRDIGCHMGPLRPCHSQRSESTTDTTGNHCRQSSIARG